VRYWESLKDTERHSTQISTCCNYKNWLRPKMLDINRHPWFVKFKPQTKVYWLTPVFIWFASPSLSLKIVNWTEKVLWNRAKAWTCVWHFLNFCVNELRFIWLSHLSASTMLILYNQWQWMHPSFWLSCMSLAGKFKSWRK